MDLRRLRKGEWIIGASGLILIVSLFLPWYRVESASLDVTAFEAFSVFDILLVVLAVCGIALVVVVAAQEAPAMGIATEALLTLFAGAVTILLVFRVLNVPGDLEGGGEATAFAWIGLAAAFGVFAGSLVAMRDERLSREGRPTDSTGVPVDAHPEIETLPAP